MLFPHDKYGSTTVDQYAKQLMVNSNKIYAMTRPHRTSSDATEAGL